MRRSDGGKQRVVLSEEARERQQIRDLAVVLQQASPVAAHQVLAPARARHRRASRSSY